MDLSNDYNNRIQTIRASVRLTKIIDALFHLPVVQISDLARELGVHYQTAKADVNRLEDLGILNQLEDMNPITYIAPEIIDVTFRDSIA